MRAYFVSVLRSESVAECRVDFVAAAPRPHEPLQRTPEPKIDQSREALNVPSPVPLKTSKTDSLHGHGKCAAAAAAASPAHPWRVCSFF
jgi:hypothetical protein